VSQSKTNPYIQFLDGPKVAIPPSEFKRLRELLGTVPGPATWFVPKYPPLKGPGGIELRWTNCGGNAYPTRLTPAGKNSPSYLDIGIYSYPMRLRDDRLLVWRQVGKRKTGFRQKMRLTVVDTTSLQPLGWFPKRTKDDRTTFKGGLAATVDLPVSLKRGVHPVDFPPSFEGIQELLLLVDDFESPGGPFESLYSVRSEESLVEVFPLDWWNKGDFDYGYQWIAMVVRDPVTGNILGDGFRLTLFFMSPNCEFLHWLIPSSEKVSSGSSTA